MTTLLSHAPRYPDLAAALSANHARIDATPVSDAEKAELRALLDTLAGAPFWVAAGPHVIEVGGHDLDKGGVAFERRGNVAARRVHGEGVGRDRDDSAANAQRRCHSRRGEQEASRGRESQAEKSFHGAGSLSRSRWLVTTKRRWLARLRSHCLPSSGRPQTSVVSTAMFPCVARE
jgi:hypothetical protein